jgi:predicted ABC-type ATPase
MKQLWLLVGGNGAGKSSFYRLMLQPYGLPFVNADSLASLVYPEDPEAHSYEAALLAEKQRNTLLLNGASFCFETVYSHPSKLDFAARAKALGYRVIMVFLHLECAELNVARVAQWMSEGGHAMPTDKVIQRIPRTLALMKASIPLCDEVHVVDNSSADESFRLALTFKDGCVHEQQQALPAWAEQLLQPLLTGCQAELSTARASAHATLEIEGGIRWLGLQPNA